MSEITNRFPSYCKTCKKRIPVGARVFWEKGKGTRHIGCNPAPKPTPKTATPKSVDFTIDWIDLKDLTRKLHRGESLGLRPANEAHIRSLLCTPDSWHGFTRGQLERWIDAGYETSAISGLSEFTPIIREKRRLKFTEEGDEFHADLAMAGDERFMSEWTKREIIPGIALDCTIDFSAAVPAEIVNAYNAWICRTVYSLESAGIDSEVTLNCPATNSIAGISGVTNQRVRVKRENEATDFVSFSAMLSPAAMRGFLFGCIVLNADKEGKDVSSSFGGTVSHEWGVKYDPEKRRINVTSLASASSFPEEKMTEQFRAALKEAMGG